MCTYPHPRQYGWNQIVLIWLWKLQCPDTWTLEQLNNKSSSVLPSPLQPCPHILFPFTCHELWCLPVSAQVTCSAGLHLQFTESHCLKPNPDWNHKTEKFILTEMYLNWSSTLTGRRPPHRGGVGSELSVFLKWCFSCRHMLGLS